METIFKVVVFIGMGILTLLVLLPLWALLAPVFGAVGFLAITWLLIYIAQKWF